MRGDFWLIIPSVLIAFYQSQIVWKALPTASVQDTEISGKYGKFEWKWYDLVKKMAYLLFWAQAFFVSYPITTNQNGMLILKVVGYIFVIFGLCISLSALKTLGTNWTGMMEYRIKKGQTLQKSGIYHYIRHPMYLAVILEAMGYELIVTSWLFFPVLLITLWIHLRHIHNEEALLERKFGGEYLKYKKETRSLIPYLL